MNIVEFFQHRAGTWTSTRTSHHLIIKKAESGTSEIHLEMLPVSDLQVVELCEQHGFSSDLALCAAKVTWDGSMEWDKKDDTTENPHQGFTIFVPIADGDDMSRGKLLRHQGYAEKAPVVGRYVMSSDGVLSLITEYGTVYSEEKFWFPRPNLCLRAGLTIGMSNVTSFCTEIRKPAPTKANTEAAQTKTGTTNT
ncbi:MAG: phycobiliprotein lyase [Pseudanabaena sp. RU_4_16]|nr:phycobiliprotein lyase [Pseudanabaena sp. RU_4_16]